MFLGDTKARVGAGRCTPTFSTIDRGYLDHMRGFLTRLCRCREMDLTELSKFARDIGLMPTFIKVALSNTSVNHSDSSLVQVNTLKFLFRQVKKTSTKPHGVITVEPYWSNALRCHS